VTDQSEKKALYITHNDWSGAESQYHCDSHCRPSIRVAKIAI